MKKKFYMFASLLLATIGMMSLSSCEIDESNEISYTLEGTWSGQMHVEYEWDGYWYETSRSEVTFLRDPYRYSSGDGYWVDYFKGRVPWRYDYIANHIEWKVRNGNIYIYFIEDDMDMVIRNYRLSNNRFVGEVYASDGAWYDFDLRRTGYVSYDNYYWGWDDYYYAKGNNPSFTDDAVITRANDGSQKSKPVRKIVKK